MRSTSGADFDVESCLNYCAIPSPTMYTSVEIHGDGMVYCYCSNAVPTYKARVTRSYAIGACPGNPSKSCGGYNDPYSGVQGGPNYALLYTYQAAADISSTPVPVSSTPVQSPLATGSSSVMLFNPSSLVSSTMLAMTPPVQSLSSPQPMSPTMLQPTSPTILQPTSPTLLQPTSPTILPPPGSTQPSNSLAIAASPSVGLPQSVQSSMLPGSLPFSLTDSMQPSSSPSEQLPNPMETTQLPTALLSPTTNPSGPQQSLSQPTNSPSNPTAPALPSDLPVAPPPNSGQSPASSALAGMPSASPAQASVSATPLESSSPSPSPSQFILVILRDNVGQYKRAESDNAFFSFGSYSPNCEDADIFHIDDEGQLFYDNELGVLDTDNQFSVAPQQGFQIFEPLNPVASITTTFYRRNGYLWWENADFTEGHAAFCLLLNGATIALFDGLPDPNTLYPTACEVVSLYIIPSKFCCTHAHTHSLSCRAC